MLMMKGVIPRTACPFGTPMRMKLHGTVIFTRAQRGTSHSPAREREVPRCALVKMGWWVASGGLRRGGGGGVRREGDVVAQGAERGEGAQLLAVALALVEVVGAEVLVRGAVGQHVIGDGDQAVGDGDDGALAP